MSAHRTVHATIGSIAAAIIVFLAVPTGCGTQRAAGPAPSPAESSGTLETDAWGPETNDLSTRLTCLDPYWMPGKPLRFKLELRNTSDRRIAYDDQQVKVNEPFVITGPDGRRVPWTGSSVQTVGHAKPIEPGETIVLVESLDVAGSYLIIRTGEYRVRSREHRGFGEAAIPASNTASFRWLPQTSETGQAGPALPPETVLLARIHDRLPERWEVAMDRAHSYARPDGLAIHCTWVPPSHLKSELVVTGVLLRSGKADDLPGKTWFNDAPLEFLGEHALGQAYLVVNPAAEATWPGYRKDLREALGL